MEENNNTHRVILTIDKDIYNKVKEASKSMGLKPSEMIKVWIFNQVKALSL